MYTDTVADMLTRIRNANREYKEFVDMPHSNEKESIIKVLFMEGYISKYEVQENGYLKNLRVYLKYAGKQRVITNLKRISKSGVRIYVDKDNVPKVLNGLGIAILSTSQGIMCDKEARRKKIGGEVVAYVW